ncbi:MAG: cell envelope integrity protein TolA [Spirochaetaceae bacterium]|nr:cell envelope integrity protein TolA [Myxococcales bacterium]MCB9724443.1 cell envelope integrity protein TolA [Spirochaetaceae bacterium]
MTADAIGWQDEHLFDHRRRVRNATCVSLALHGLVFAAFAIAPPMPVAELPEVISVDLVAGPAGAAPPAARGGRPPKAEPAPPAEASPPPAPTPAPKPAPPVAKAPVQVLPEESPSQPEKKKETKPETKPTPPAPKPPPVAKEAKPAESKATPDPRPRKAEPMSYEDAMAALDDELGEDDTADLLAPRPAQPQKTASSGSTGEPGSSRGGVAVSAELANWIRETQRRIQSQWVTPASLRGRGLATTLELRLSPTGDVLGEPRVVRSSGDPNFDDNAVRAVMKVSPLPPPPQPGLLTFIFRSEAT